MSEPRRGEVRQAPGGRVFYVRGASDPDDGPYTSPHVDLVEVEGRYIGARFASARDAVATWPLLSVPVEITAHQP